MYEKIPNALSVSRIILAILVILISAHLEPLNYIVTISILALAMVTDALDGYLARRWGTTSDLGYVLDTMGDRAIHLALVLVFLVRYSFHPLFVWLLLFRDIGIYAVRVLTKDWLDKSRQMRPVFLFHTTCLRIWLGSFLIRDGFRVFMRSDVLNTFAFEAAQITLLCITIVVSYYGLFHSFSWLVDRDHHVD
ncbi:MAG TPA: CDP-alcohol phosphatidyltransferase family protein [Pyrinomonadaceae bacterium]|nr:CDP-alcohol phosphatidyltransferase family protein [Pyrinomonadaceae bacterium]